MKINIDTKEDSVEDIKNLIRMLQGMINEAPEYISTSEKFSSTRPENAGDLFSDNATPENSISTPVLGMFDDPAPAAQTQPESEDKEQDGLPEVQVY